MALVSGGRSTLNPDAPLFIPAAFRQVEDFSPEWWQLVTTSPWYHSYWLSQNQEEDGFYTSEDNNIDNIADLLPESFDLDAGDDFSNFEAQFEEFIQFSEKEAEKQSPLLFNTMNGNGFAKDNGLLIQNMKYLEERSSKFQVEHAKFAEKAAKYNGPKYSPRRIQQPR